MLRMYFLQQWYTLADEALEDALYDSQAMREFIGIDLGRENVPDATTLLKFRRLLEQHDPTSAILAEVNAHLAERGLLMRQGTVVDASIIAAPSSTKNEDGKRHRDAPGQEGQPVALRHEDALGRGRRVGPDSQRRVHGGQ
jgi:IS5 family transposase